MRKKIKEYISVNKASQILGITIPGVFSANKRGSLVIYEIDSGINVLKLSDVMKYKRTRRNGRPRKFDNE